MNTLKENKQAILFLVIFIAVYVGLNTLYGVFIQFYLPATDPITIAVTGQVSLLLSWIDPSISSSVNRTSNFVNVSNSQRIVLSVFEGCNGINVMIVFLAFLIAFRGSFKLTAKFMLVGIFSIYCLNLLRVAGLYFVELYFQQYMYFFHKYFFTGILYCLVFTLWYVWTKLVKREHGLIT